MLLDGSQRKAGLLGGVTAIVRSIGRAAPSSRCVPTQFPFWMLGGLGKQQIGQSRRDLGGEYRGYMGILSGLTKSTERPS